MSMADLAHKKPEGAPFEDVESKSNYRVAEEDVSLERRRMEARIMQVNVS